MQTIIERENAFGAHNYHPLPVVLTRGEGVYVWDIDGKRYIDMMSAYSAVSHGHAHPALLAAATQQLHQLTVVSRAFYTEILGKFLQKACTTFGFERALPMNTGAEAVETAIKAARKWAYEVKKVPDNTAEIIVCEENFHGRTTTIVSFSSSKESRDHFGPATPGFRSIPYGDSAALEGAITPHTAAFLIEPIQGEAGIILPPKGYLAEAAAICRERNVLFIADEIQTGLGRTGALLACHHERVVPDAVLLGKALGGGILPVSLFLAKREIMEVFTPGTHGSTFGGNPLAAAVALKALEVLEEEQLAENSAKLGEYFLRQLQGLRHPLIAEVRGRGLFIGLEIEKSVPARRVALQLLERGILCKETRATTLRLAPPLIIRKEHIDEAVVAIEQVLKSFV